MATKFWLPCFLISDHFHSHKGTNSSLHLLFLTYFRTTRVRTNNNLIKNWWFALAFRVTWLNAELGGSWSAGGSIGSGIAALGKLISSRSLLLATFVSFAVGSGFAWLISTSSGVARWHDVWWLREFFVKSNHLINVKFPTLTAF